MIVKYDQLDRLERPVFSLCNPGSIYDNGKLSKMVGILVDTEAEEFVFNFNALSELNMRVNLLPREDPKENEYVRSVFDAIQNRRLIFAENIGYFVITNVSDGYSDRFSYKDITAKSVDAELQQKMIPYITDGTYRFKSDTITNNKGILESIVDTLPLWKIGHVDASVASKWRTFEDVDTSLNCLAFLINKVQDAYECIILFDIIHRIINVYARDNYVRQTNIHITKDDLINSIHVDENADDIYTAIRALGGDSVSIAAVNPLGTNVIYAFDYYLSWMSNSLRTKVVAWEAAVDSAFNDHYQLSREYYQQLELATSFEQDIEKINTQITMYERCRDNIVAQSSTDIINQYNPVIEKNGGDAISIDKEIDATLQEIDKLIDGCNKSLSSVQTKLNTANQTLATKKTAIDKIHDSLNILSYFTEDEYTELCLYIYEGNYSDEYVIITDSMSYEEKFEQIKLLYDRAKSQLDKVSVPTQEFNIDVESFIFVKEFSRWSEQLETGCLINVELDINDIAAIFLASITVNYDDHSMKLTFGNRYNKYDPKSLFDNMLGNISKSANTLNYIKAAIYPIKNGEFSAIREVLQTSRDLTMNAALAATNEEVMIDASGYTGKRLLSNGEFDDRQIKIVSNSIVFTEDGWDSCSLALGNIILDDSTTIYGINAKAVFGDMIIGGGLKIYDKNGNEILSVIDGIQTRVSTAEGDISTLEQTATSLTSRIGTAEGDISSLEQTATSLTSRIKTAEGDISTLEQTATSLTSRIGTAEGDISSLEQTIDGFTLSVSNGETSSTISLKSGSTTIKSVSISMTGLVTFSDLSTSGKTTIHGGNITTGTLSASKITSGTLDADKVTISNLTVDAAAITSGTIESARIPNLSADKITSGTLSGTRIDGSTLVITSGATIAGWNLDGNSIYKSSGSWGSGTFMCTGSSSPYSIGGSSSMSGWVFGAGGKFGVTSSGAVWCSNIHATGGKIAGLTIENNRLYYNDEVAAATMIGKDSIELWSGNESFRVFRETNSRTINIRAVSKGSDYSESCEFSMYHGQGRLSGTWVGTASETIISDLNKKHSIGSLDGKYSLLFDLLTPVKYKYNDGTSDRYHTGFVAQDVEFAIKNAGLTTQDFAAFVTIDKNTEEVCSGLRYDEFVALNTWQIQELKTRVAQLEYTIGQIQSTH